MGFGWIDTLHLGSITPPHTFCVSLVVVIVIVCSLLRLIVVSLVVIVVSSSPPSPLVPSSSSSSCHFPLPLLLIVRSTLNAPPFISPLLLPLVMRSALYAPSFSSTACLMAQCTAIWLYRSRGHCRTCLTVVKSISVLSNPSWHCWIHLGVVESSWPSYNPSRSHRRFLALTLVHGIVVVMVVEWVVGAMWVQMSVVEGLRTEGWVFDVCTLA